MSSDTERMVHELGSLLEGLLEGKAEVRKPAETRLQDLVATSPAETLYGLSLIGQGVAAYPLESRCLSLVLLRRLAFTSQSRTTLPPPHNTPFDVISEQQRARIEQCLISGLEGEIEGKVRKGLADVVGKWVEETGKRGRPLTSLQPLLIRLTSSPSPLHRLTTYQLLSTTPSLLCHAPTVSGSQEQSTVTPEQVAHVLEMGVGDQVVQVRVEAVKAICQVLGSTDAMDKKGRERVGKGLIEKVVQVLIALAADPTHYDQVITPLIELASYHPNLFSSSLPTLLPFLQCLCLPPTSSLPQYLLPNTYTSITSAPPPTFPPEDTRSSPSADPESLAAAENERFERTIELLLTLAETSKKSVLKMWIKEGAMQMVPVLLGRMIMGLGEKEGSEAEAKLGVWLEEEDLDEEDENYPIIPEDSLDRLSGILPTAPFLQNLFGYIAQMVTDSDWRARYAGLMAIAAVGETTVEVMSESLQQIIGMILPLAHDPEPRVRYALCHCLGQLATDFEDSFLQQLAPQIIQTEIALLDDPQNRVRAHAAASLVNLSDIATAEIIRPYLDLFMQGIGKMLQNTPIYVQEQCLTTLASIAVAAEKDFAKYYGSIMPMLLNVLRDPAASGKEYRMMRARAMECCGLIGMAVGKEIFQADALQLANIMAQIQTEVTDDDDPQISYLTTTWSKLAACLKADFAPFLPHVMPTLLAKAGQKPDMIRIDDPELAAADGYHVVGLTEDEQVGIKTSGIEEKATNFECMTIYIASMGAALGSYLNQMLDLCLEGMRFLFDDRVRTAAIDTLPLLLHISKQMGNAEAVEKIFSSLNECFLREDQVEYLSLLYMKFYRCLEIMSSPLPPALRQSFDQATEFQLSAMHDERQRRRQELTEMDKSQRDEQIEWEVEEEAALDEMSKALFLVDENHPLLLRLSLVRGLAIKDAEEWEDEGEDDD